VGDSGAPCAREGWRKLRSTDDLHQVNLVVKRRLRDEYNSSAVSCDDGDGGRALGFRTGRWSLDINMARARSIKSCHSCEIESAPAAN